MIDCGTEVANVKRPENHLVLLSSDYDVARFWMERGASFLSIGFPARLLYVMGKEVIQNIRTIENERMV